MIKRKRKYDKKEFWGCTRFPKCKGIVNMSFKPVSDKPNLPTPDARFQQPILDTFLTKGGNVIVKACAGSGKTTLLKMLSYELPKNVTIAYIVFNAKIRDEALEVLPAWVSPMTSHQLGFSAVRNYNSGKTEVDGNKVQDIVKTLVRPKWDVEKWMISPVCDLVSKLKNTLAGQSNDALEALADKYGIDLNDSKERVFELVKLAMVENDRNTAVVDFDDMLYFPIKFNLAVQKYDIMLTDEVQDFNAAQLELLRLASNENTQVIAVGDEDQSLYSFRGADLDAMEKMKTFFDAESLPLSITYRVPKSGVQLVNDLFPHIPFEAAKNASEGKISASSNTEMLLEVRQGDLVLSRTNAPLIKPVFDLLKMGIKATIVGRDIGKNLINTLNRFNKSGRDLTKVLRALESYGNEEVTKLLRLNKGMQASNLTDTVSTIFALADGAKSVKEVEDRIYRIFSDNAEGISFSTVHRAKGLEANRVFILRPDQFPHPMAQQDWEKQQEKNAAYVAITRHKQELIFVEGFFKF
jgi:superfamily I DNA/RNA helicase